MPAFSTARPHFMCAGFLLLQLLMSGMWQAEILPQLFWKICRRTSGCMHILLSRLETRGKSVGQQHVLDKAESHRRSVQTFAPLNADLSLRPCVLIYDGICHLCNAGVRWVIHADKQKKISFCAVQSQAAKPYLTLCGLTEDDVLRRFLFVEGPGVSHQGSTAALKVASYLPVPYSVLTLFLVVPLPIRDAIYDYVAKHRYDWFGRSSDCIIPDDDILDRFVDRLEFQERAEQDDEDDEVN
ncbi:unnamed protein product [Sphagnum balticum]